MCCGIGLLCLVILARWQVLTNWTISLFTLGQTNRRVMIVFMTLIPGCARLCTVSKIFLNDVGT